MASAKTSFQRAVAAHRGALGMLEDVNERLRNLVGGSTHGAASAQRQTQLAARLRDLAGELATGWLGATWPVIDADRPAVERSARPGAPLLLRIGDAEPLPGNAFPVVVPLTGSGHLTIDRDARDPAVAGLLRSVLTRLLAAFPAGQLRILAVDGGALGAPLAPFRALVPAGVMNEPVTDVPGLRNVLEEAEEQVRRVQSGEEPEPDVILVVSAALPAGAGRTELARLAALAHAGPAARVHLFLAGYPPPAEGREPAPPLEFTTHVRHAGGRAPVFRVGDPPRDMFGEEGRGLNASVTLDPGPPEGLVVELCRHIAARAESDGRLEFDDLVPERLWQESSVDGLRTVVGRIGRGDAVLALDDATPHWLVGGRTGSGKTVFLLDVLYGLAARYSPDELALYLLDFKEGVSFTEFIPTEGDPSWIPHARTVGVESDRQYGVAVLTELVREMNRRATVLKQSGVTKISDLRNARTDIAMPRIVTVIDEFHVLFQGNDETAKRGAALLEEVSRKGRSYGIHLILASQSVSGIDALFGKGSSIFGQFGLRVALPGGSSVLDQMNLAADDLQVGQVVLNTTGGTKAGNRRARFPYSEPGEVRKLRQRLWNNRIPGAAEPAVFAGYAEYTLDDDPTYARLTPGVRRRWALVGRAVDVGLPAVGLLMDAVPGRNLAVLGTSPVGADMIQAAVLSLARQHEPGTATFHLSGLVAAADEVVDGTAAALTAAGHRHEVLDLAGYKQLIARLAEEGDGPIPARHTYVAVFGADAASVALGVKDRQTLRSSLDDFRRLLREGPSRNVHLLGWWRGARRLMDDLGSNGREDVAGIVALNVRGQEISGLLGQLTVEWNPRSDRALFIDKHEDIRRLLVPFVTPGRRDEEL